MEHTIMDRCDVEDLANEELYDLYELVIKEVDRRELTKQFDEKVNQRSKNG